MKTISCIFFIFLCSCSRITPCKEALESPKFSWDKLWYASIADSLTRIMTSKNLNGIYLDGDLHKLIKKIPQHMGDHLQFVWDGCSLGGIIIKDNVIVFKSYFDKEICDQFYQEWYSFGLDTSMIPGENKIILLTNGPRGWHFIRTFEN